MRFGQNPRTFSTGSLLISFGMFTCFLCSVVHNSVTREYLKSADHRRGGPYHVFVRLLVSIVRIAFIVLALVVGQKNHPACKILLQN